MAAADGTARVLAANWLRFAVDEPARRILESRSGGQTKTYCGRGSSGRLAFSEAAVPSDQLRSEYEKIRGGKQKIRHSPNIEPSE